MRSGRRVSSPHVSGSAKACTAVRIARRPKRFAKAAARDLVKAFRSKRFEGFFIFLGYT